MIRDREMDRMKNFNARQSAMAAILWATAGIVGLLATATVAVAQPAPNTLEAIDVQTLPGQQLQVTMKLSGPAPEPLSFSRYRRVASTCGRPVSIRFSPRKLRAVRAW